MGKSCDGNLSENYEKRKKKGRSNENKKVYRIMKSNTLRRRISLKGSRNVVVIYKV